MSNFLHGTDNRAEIQSDMQAQLPASLPRAVVALEGLINRIAERTVARRTAAMPRESRRFDPTEASKTHERLRRRVSELQALNPDEPDYVSKAEIALDNAVSTVNDEFGERSDEASALSSALIVADSGITLADFRHNSAGRDKASATARIREATSRLQNLQRIVFEKTVEPSAATRTTDVTPPPSRRVFLVHGHKEETKLAVARLLERLDLEPIILHEKPDMNRTIIEKFEAHTDVGFAVILMTADDRGGPATASTDTYQPRARQNVLLEMGFFLGRLGRGHVCVLYEPGVEMPSDYSGVLYKPLDSAGNWKWELAREIDAARIPVDFNRLK